MKSFVQYIFKRLVGEYLKPNVGLSNFNISPLRMEALELNSDSFNRKFLRNAPFLMSSGTIGSLTANLPSFLKIVDESIYLEANDIHIIFTYNQELSYHKWVQSKLLKKGNNGDGSKDEEELYEPKEKKIDIFEKIVRKVLYNLKIKVNNLAISFRFEQTAPEKKTSFMRFPELLFKLKSAEIKKTLDEFSISESKKLESSLVNDKIHDYDINFSGLSMHLINKDFYSKVG